MNPCYDFLDTLDRGMFYAKKEYSDAALLPIEELWEKLPQPVVEAKPLWEECYRYAVELAFRNRKVPTPESGFVSNFVDAAFNEDIFLWDTVFITMFCNLLHPYIPGIRSLDNFYCKQFDDGEIPREMVRETGKDFLRWVNAYGAPLYSYFHNHYGHRRLGGMGEIPYEEMFKPDLGREVEKHPYLTLDNLNHPIAAWAEWVSFLHTGDTVRLGEVFAPLLQYYRALRYHLRHQNGLYVTDWASMDNSPRNRYLGCGVDISCEMVLFAHNLLDILQELEEAGTPVRETQEIRRELEEDAGKLAELINRKLWNSNKGFYYDLSDNGTQAPVKTIAAYWAMAAGIANWEQADHLARWLEDKDTFNRPHRVPVLAADEEGYNPQGGYWSGSVWAPTNTMVLYGLEKYGYGGLARDIALNHLDAVCKVYQDTGSIWENYPADSITSGDADKKDFVGWSGIGPILYLMQYGVGLTADAPTRSVSWNIDAELLEQGAVGCRQYWFFGCEADFLATRTGDKVHVEVKTTHRFALTVRYKGLTEKRTITGDTAIEL